MRFMVKWGKIHIFLRIEKIEKGDKHQILTQKEPYLLKIKGREHQSVQRNGKLLINLNKRKMLLSLCYDLSNYFYFSIFCWQINIY